MEEQNKGAFRILLAGLPGVGKRTIINRFKEGYKLYKDRVKSSKNISTEDGTIRDNLKGRAIELSAVDILGGAGLEYSAKKDLSSYDIVAIVFDLGDKDSIKKVAQTILLESQLNFRDLKSRCLKALWGNKKDLFKNFGDTDELTAQIVMKLKSDYQMLSYIKSSSILSTLNNNKLANTEDTKHNEQSLVSSDDPFQCVSQLICDYFDKTSSQGQSTKSDSQDLSATNQSSSSSQGSFPQNKDDFVINHMKKQAINRPIGSNNHQLDCGTSFSKKKEKPFPSLDGKNKKNGKKDSCGIF